MGAHPQGAYMAYAIEQSFGRAILIETLDNPFAFLRAYRRAARLEGAYVFSDAAMAVFADLERRYVQTRKGKGEAIEGDRR